MEVGDNAPAHCLTLLDRSAAAEFNHGLDVVAWKAEED